MSKKLHSESFRVLCMILVLVACMMTFATIQPFGDGPDEINRFKIVEYIYKHGTLPVGDDPEVLIDGFGASYAFQPMLTYMIDGYLLRAVSVFEPTLEMRVFISRLVDVFMGLITALYVKKLGDLLFDNKKTVWFFTLAVAFLPQNMFVHTYVNTDSMGLLSIAIVLHASILGMKEEFSKKSCVELAIGIILCALSYYNCYGIVLCAILLFGAYFVKIKSNKVSYDYQNLLKKGILISVIVLLGISWWFIRNGILYDGDILALEARQICAAQTCTEPFNPYTRDTYQRLGIPLIEMVFGTDYFTLVWRSFIAMFGPMRIPTHHYIYWAFAGAFFLCVIGLLIPKKAQVLTWMNRYQKICVNVTMVIAIVIPVILALYYSYTYDFQPQGRYYLPMVIPFMYFLTIGFEKLVTLLSDIVGKKNPKMQAMSCAFMYHAVYAFLTFCLLYSTFVAMIGYYKVNGGSLF
ncbi:MAG: hypothetical protein IKL49_00805 [Lachnospiraceae bacterium]|nr:hypothetical protein [Lachnospiraceae bacterium]